MGVGVGRTPALPSRICRRAPRAPLFRGKLSAPSAQDRVESRPPRSGRRRADTGTGTLSGILRPGRREEESTGPAPSKSTGLNRHALWSPATDTAPATLRPHRSRQAPPFEQLPAAAASGRGAPMELGMEGAAGDPYRRPARRTQWLLSALAHHYGLDRGVENEIVVLATGLDQYLQEVFHHLDCRGAGRLPRADFRALCAVLGLRAEGAAAGDGAEGDARGGDVAADRDSNSGVVVADGDTDAEEEARLALRAEPPELTFRQFHARLCGYFGTREGPRLPRGALSEHIETQIRLRRPRRRRRRPPRAPGPDGGPDGSGPDGERVARLEEENGSLRELVEDLRAALQSSDARCLALQVGLWKSQAGAPEAAARELRRAQGALAAAEARAGWLRRCHAEVRRRAEEARLAVLRSLRRVRELEALARQVPGLQRWGRRLETELRRYRAEGVHVPSPPRASLEPGDKIDEPEDTGPRDPDATPEGAWQSDGSWGSRALDEEDEQLFRSVEGQAASDKEEEEEEKWREVERPAAQAEARPLGCGSRCDDQTARKLLMYLGRCGDAEHTCTPGELEAHVARLLEHLDIQGCDGKSLGPCAEEAELQQKVAENEHLRLELQMVETERVRLSLLEEKLVDVLQLLQRLRDLNISKRALGKILLSTLDAFGDPTQEGRLGPLAILDALHQALAGCELLQTTPLGPGCTAPALANPLLISC
ncbi:EF-hand and coiled-coil domain-containing protein 1 [Heterocephalus glaber]|uniref:EF-hand and coiled-coil domain-containing protein 1 n=1 Tax=Heterocephalus glaber TaxID=10181 RepID=A0AAX6PP70_HETGA|nr:EF-hand and coiled-coil domain-containing protein 1 [Heterocephalus glaber]